MLKKTWPHAIVKAELPMIYSVLQGRLGRGWLNFRPSCMNVDGENAKKHIKEGVTILKEDVAAWVGIDILTQSP